VVTVGRSDYGILLPVLRALHADARVELQLLAGGAHGAGPGSDTLPTEDPDAFVADARVDMQAGDDTPVAIAKSLGLGVIGFADAYHRLRPDIVVLLGDRFEMLAAAAAAVPLTIPLAHIHGGETTEGAIDEQMRHAITKMSHLHFAATHRAAGRIVQMGEEPWRVTVSGAPALDNMRATALLPREALERTLGIALTPPPLLVTFHPVTLEIEDTGRQVEALIAALSRMERPIVITHPNADAAHRTVLDALTRFATGRSNVRLVSNLGPQGYFSMMECAGAMVGNSSSGIIEAASFRLPVVNIGQRQAGRERCRNVIDVACAAAEITAGITRALTPEFAASLAGLENPYGDGHAAGRITEVIASVALDERLRVKRFHACAAS
jgi:UDP-hydrolysing UDP-N-acetyl-D-glucosamine 2-epimerase